MTCKLHSARFNLFIGSFVSFEMSKCCKYEEDGHSDFESLQYSAQSNILQCSCIWQHAFPRWHTSYIFTNTVSPNMTYAVDWALQANYLSIYLQTTFVLVWLLVFLKMPKILKATTTNVRVHQSGQQHILQFKIT